MHNVAVIGYANLFPGSKTPAEFWINLLNKVDSRSTTPASRVRMDDEIWLGGKGETDRVYCNKGGYVGKFELDYGAFRLPAAYLKQLDDGLLWSLYVAHEALLSAGYRDQLHALERCGVIMGNLTLPTASSNDSFLPLYHEALQQALRQLFGRDDIQVPAYSTSHPEPLENQQIASAPATLLARALGLGGAHFCLDAACASSLYSVKLACDYLLTNKADMMLAGAVSAADPFYVNSAFSVFQAYPEDGRSAPLDADSRGLFASEGAGMLVLKRYQDAINEGDKVLAVIRATALSNDGRGEFILSPNAKGQALAYERAYIKANVDPRSVGYIECHATGTSKGDRVELNSLEDFFGAHGSAPYIGSVKSNIGHLLTAAGIPSMMKSIMSLNAQVVPPTINIEKPLSSTHGKISATRIPRVNTNWLDIAGHAAPRAAVSAFGFGGCNAHIIFEKHRDNASSSSPFPHQAALHTDMAITGMAAHFGSASDLASLAQAIRSSRPLFRSLPPQRWKGLNENPLTLQHINPGSDAAPPGAYIEDFELDFLHFKIPPKDDDLLIPQQLLLLKIADQALHAAAINENSNVAVLVAMGAELELHQYRGRILCEKQISSALETAGIQLNSGQQQELIRICKDSLQPAASINRYTSFIGNIMASRISSLWNFSGPAFTVSSEENSVARCLEIAENLFQTGPVEAVVIAAVDLAGSAEAVLARHHRATSSLHGWPAGEGAGAVVLRPLRRMQEGDRMQAIIRGIGFSAGVDDRAVEDAASQALRSARLDASQVKQLDISTTADSPAHDAEQQGLSRAFGSLPASSSPVRALVGDTRAAAGIASLISTALQLQEQDADSCAGISCIGLDHTTSHIILSAPGADRASGPDSSPIAQHAAPGRQLIKRITLGGPSLFASVAAAAGQLNLPPRPAAAPQRSEALPGRDVDAADPNTGSQQHLQQLQQRQRQAAALAEDIKDQLKAELEKQH